MKPMAEAFLADMFTSTMESARKRPQLTIRCPTPKVKEMVLNNDHIQDNEGYPVNTPGPTGASMAHQLAGGRRPLVAHPGDPWNDVKHDARAGDDHPPQQNLLPKG